MSKEVSRHEIRKMALQALFPLDFNQDLSKQDAIMHAIELEHHEIIDEEQENFVPGYLDQLVGGVCERKAELDEIIQSHLKKGGALSGFQKWMSRFYESQSMKCCMFPKYPTKWR